jgi:hypothetical protein
MPTDLQRSWAYLLVAPLVKRRDGNLQFRRQLASCQQLILCHEQMEPRTVCYLGDMSENSDSVRVDAVHSAGVLETGWAAPATVRLRHEHWPELLFELELAQGSVRKVTVENRSATSPSITATLLRQPVFGELSRAASDAVRGHLEALTGESAPKLVGEWAASQLALIDFTVRPGARGRSDADYASLAARYVEICETSHSPIAALAGELNWSRGTVRNAISKARDKGLLAAGVPGKAGGALTDRALKALTAAREKGVSDG